MEQKIMAILLALALFGFIFCYLSFNYKNNKRYAMLQNDFEKRLEKIKQKVKESFDKETATDAYNLIIYELNNPKYDSLSEDNKNLLHYELRDLGGRISIINYYNGENNLKKQDNAG